jgi:hypothetical protein
VNDQAVVLLCLQGGASHVETFGSKMTASAGRSSRIL